MLQEMTGRQFAEWQAYYLVEPFGPQVEAHRAAQSLAMMANLWGGKRRYEAKDFLPPERMSSRQQENWWQQFAESVNNGNRR